MMRRPSIRTRLLLWSTIVTTVILIAAGCILYKTLKESLYAQYDRLLDEAATIVMIEVEVKDSEVYHEWKESLEDHVLHKDRTLIQVWDYHSDVSVRSAALGDFNLERNYGKLSERVFYNLLLPNGKRGRAVGVLIHPRIEHEEGNEGFVPEMHPQIFVWAQNAEDLHKILLRTKKTFVIGGGTVIVLLWGAIWVVISLSSRAMQSMTNEVLSRKDHEMGRPIPVPDNLPSEVAGMAYKFNELLAKIDQMREKDRDFFLNVAHEVRTPLAGVHAIIEQALRKPRETHDYRRRLEEALVGTSGLRSLINRLMKFGRLKKSEEDLECELVDINQLLKRLWEAFRQKASERQLESKWNLTGECIVKSDPELVKIVLSNLLENAVTYASEGTVISIETSCEAGGVQIVLGNSIDGLNLGSEDISRFFDPFYRNDQSRDQSGDHAGIGLSFCSEIMEILGGRVSGQAVGVDGVSFCVVIPSISIS